MPFRPARQYRSWCLTLISFVQHQNGLIRHNPGSFKAILAALRDIELYLDPLRMTMSEQNFYMMYI